MTLNEMTRHDMTLDAKTVDTTWTRHNQHHHDLLDIDKAAGQTAKPDQARARETLRSRPPQNTRMKDRTNG